MIIQSFFSIIKIVKNKKVGKNMKKGFTLIELLAVIVILAIIALIATPIVLDIIEDSKNSSIRESANMYKSAAENAIATSAMNDGLEDGTYIIDNKGNLKYKDKEIKVDIKNYNFESGILVIEQGQIKDIKLIQNEKVTTGKELNKIDKWDGKTIKEITADSNGIYHITKASELAWVAQQVNNGETFEGKTISLDASLDLGGRYDKDGNKLGTEWIPIGVAKSSSQINYFKGTFEGNNNIISGIYITKSIEKIENAYDIFGIGLFGYIDSAVINNLTIKDAYLTGYKYIGALGAYVKNSKINNVIVDNVYAKANNTISGIVGFATGTSASNLHSYNSTITGITKYIGGVVGVLQKNSSLSNSYSNSIIKKEGTDSDLGTGGIVGEIITNSTADRLVSESIVTGYTGVGGVVGHFQNNCKLTNVISYAKVTGNNYLGGVIGTFTGYPSGNTIENIKSYAEVIGNEDGIGGVIGLLNLGSNYLTDIYSKSNVKGKDKLGGITGSIENSETIINYRNVISESTIEGETNIGNLWGYQEENVTKNEINY